MPYYFGSSVVCKFCCGSCSATYYGETYLHLFRVGEHSGLTWKKSKSKKSTAAKDHMLFCDHIMSIEDFKILLTSDSDLHVKVKESLLIFHDYYYYFYSYHESGFLNHIYIKVNRLFTPVKKI